MRISIFACRIFNRELSQLAAQSENEIEIHWLPQGLHDVTDTLRGRLRAALDTFADDIRSERVKRRPDYIGLGYGLCSNGIIGLESRDIPIVVPRVDDCIALFLGSQKRYLRLFDEMSGTYWLNNGWIESCGTLVDMQRLLQQKRQVYAERFGEDNADYLIEQERQWTQRYRACGYIRSETYDPETYRRLARNIAEEHGWDYREQPGDLRMLRLLTQGRWNEEEFLICPPYHRIAADYGGMKIRAVPLTESA
jgi:hypothetical protein